MGFKKHREKEESSGKIWYFFYNTGKRRRASEKIGEHRKKKELWYNTKKMWSSPRKAGEIGENTGKRWRNTRKKWRAIFFRASPVRAEPCFFISAAFSFFRAGGSRTENR